MYHMKMTLRLVISNYRTLYYWRFRLVILQLQTCPYASITPCTTVECREQITTLLTDLGCTLAEVSCCQVLCSDPTFSCGKVSGCWSVCFPFYYQSAAKLSYCLRYSVIVTRVAPQIAKNSPKLTPESLKRARFVVFLKHLPCAHWWC